MEDSSTFLTSINIKSNIHEEKRFAKNRQKDFEDDIENALGLKKEDDTVEKVNKGLFNYFVQEKTKFADFQKIEDHYRKQLQEKQNIFNNNKLKIIEMKKQYKIIKQEILSSLETYFQFGSGGIDKYYSEKMDAVLDEIQLKKHELDSYNELHKNLYKENYLLKKKYEDEIKIQTLNDEQFDKYKNIQNHAIQTVERQQYLLNTLVEFHVDAKNSQDKEYSSRLKKLNNLNMHIIEIKKDAMILNQEINKVKHKQNLIQQKIEENKKINQNIKKYNSVIINDYKNMNKQLNFIFFLANPENCNFQDPKDINSLIKSINDHYAKAHDFNSEFQVKNEYINTLILKLNTLENEKKEVLKEKMKKIIIDKDGSDYKIKKKQILLNKKNIESNMKQIENKKGIIFKVFNYWSKYINLMNEKISKMTLYSNTIPDEFLLPINLEKFYEMSDDATKKYFTKNGNLFNSIPNTNTEKKMLNIKFSNNEKNNNISRKNSISGNLFKSFSNKKIKKKGENNNFFNKNNNNDIPTQRSINNKYSINLDAFRFIHISINKNMILFIIKIFKIFELNLVELYCVLFHCIFHLPPEEESSKESDLKYLNQFKLKKKPTTEIKLEIFHINKNNSLVNDKLSELIQNFHNTNEQRIRMMHLLEIEKKKKYIKDKENILKLKDATDKKELKMSDEDLIFSYVQFVKGQNKQNLTENNYNSPEKERQNSNITSIESTKKSKPKINKINTKITNWDKINNNNYMMKTDTNFFKDYNSNNHRYNLSYNEEIDSDEVDEQKEIMAKKIKKNGFFKVKSNKILKLDNPEVAKIYFRKNELRNFELQFFADKKKNFFDTYTFHTLYYNFRTKKKSEQLMKKKSENLPKISSPQKETIDTNYKRFYTTGNNLKVNKKGLKGDKIKLKTTTERGKNNNIKKIINNVCLSVNKINNKNATISDANYMTINSIKNSDNNTERQDLNDFNKK